jgi:hypothetical protein
MPIVKLDNPAGKLYAFFKRVQDPIVGTTTQSQLAHALGTESDDAKSVSKALLDLYELATDAERKAALPEIAGQYCSLTTSRRSQLRTRRKRPY